MNTKWIPVLIIMMFLINACASPSTGMTDEEAVSVAMTAIAETEQAETEEQPPALTAAPTRTIAPTSTSKPPTATPEQLMGTFSNPYPFDWKENMTWWMEYEDWSTGSILKYDVGITDLKWG